MADDVATEFYHAASTLTSEKEDKEEEEEEEEAEEEETEERDSEKAPIRRSTTKVAMITETNSVHSGEGICIT